MKTKRYRPIKRHRKFGSVCRCNALPRPMRSTLTAWDRQDIDQHCHDLVSSRAFVKC